MSTTMPGPVLAVAEVSKRFAGVAALDGVSLDLYPGEVHALIGENGAGKSTLIKVITGVHRPDGGTVRYRGSDVAFAAPRDAQAAGISTIYQEVSLVPAMSVARNLFLGREPVNRLGLIDVGRMHREATALLARCGVEVDVRRAAGGLGLEGELLYSAPDDQLGPLQLIVVGQFPPGQRETAETVGRILKQRQTRLYRLEEAPRLFEEIKSSAKPIPDSPTAAELFPAPGDEETAPAG